MRCMQRPALLQLAQEVKLLDALESFVHLLLACADNVGMPYRPKGRGTDASTNLS
jgi:hypothetical protein